MSIGKKLYVNFGAMLALVVVLFNRAVWKPLYRLAAERFALAR